MRQAYNPENLNLWLQYYADQAGQTGYGDLPAFRGTPYQRGAGLGSFFRSLFRMAIPVIKSAASRVGKQALATGANIASDIAQGRNFEESIRDRARHSATELIKEASSALEPEQEGQGLGIRPKSIYVSENDVFNQKPKRKTRKK